MSDKGSKKNGMASLRKAVRPEVESKVFFVGKWNAGHTLNDELMSTISASITSTSGLRTKLRMYKHALKVGEKSSIFSAFPEQTYPMSCIKSLKRDEKQTNTIVVTTQTVAQIYEVHVYRCPTEYEARQIVDCYSKNKVIKQPDMLPEKKAGDSDVNWSLRATNTSTKKYPRAVIATSVNGMNGHDESTTKVTADTTNKVLHIQTPEPIYATVNKTKNVSAEALQERIRILEIENLRLREFINQHLVTTYQAVPLRQTEVPIDQLLLLEGNRVMPVQNDEAYSTIRHDSIKSGENGSLNNSGQFERGSLQYQRRPEMMNGYAPSAQVRDVQTRYLVPAETLRRNLTQHTHVPRKIDHVYKHHVHRDQQIQVQQNHEPEVYQDVAESLPPRDSTSSLSNSDLEDHNTNGELFEITTPTPVRYM